jgi:pyruvate dehydrogenase (quinone)
MVLNNGDLNQVTWEQRALEGDPKFAGSQDLPAFPYAAYAELLGLKGLRVERPEDIGPAWEAALGAGCPAVLEMVTDPNVPPLPPHVTAKQAKEYLAALIKGDPDAIEVVKASAKQMWASARA